MALVSTSRQLASGHKINWRIVLWVSGGSVLGGILGNVTFDQLLLFFQNEDQVQMIQIFLTVVMLLFAFFYTQYDRTRSGFQLKKLLVLLLWPNPWLSSESFRNRWWSDQCFLIDANVRFTNQRSNYLFNLYDFFLSIGKNSNDCWNDWI